MSQRTNARATYKEGLWKRRDARYHDKPKGPKKVAAKAYPPGVPKVARVDYRKYDRVRRYYESQYALGKKHSEIPAPNF